MGALNTLSAAELGAHAIGAAPAAAHLDPGAAEAVVMGHVVQAGAGPNTARQAAVRAGFRSPSRRAPSTAG
ncbi:hypothetical protein ACFY0F_06625 [Streptomyces sp. NPDC001544]|uniref:thiolase family protein n=1 Tax=Streptomyces sp. NPDC001544 TaxID=3364584 RepID=UPI0036971CF2